jgi:hypothetical protein
LPSKCSLRRAVVEAPSVIDWIRTGPPVTGGVSPALAIRLNTRLLFDLLGTIVPPHDLNVAGPP